MVVILDMLVVFLFTLSTYRLTYYEYLANLDFLNGK